MNYKAEILHGTYRGLTQAVFLHLRLRHATLNAISHLHLVKGETEEVERWDRVHGTILFFYRKKIICFYHNVGHFDEVSIYFLKTMDFGFLHHILK